VRVLLDENLPLEFAAEIPGHDVATVRGLGWAGLQNGALMRQAADACDVFVTMDKSIPHQQHIPAMPFGVVLLAAPFTFAAVRTVDPRVRGGDQPMRLSAAPRSRRP